MPIAFALGNPQPRGKKMTKKWTDISRKGRSLIKKRKTGTGAAGEGPQHAAAM